MGSEEYDRARKLAARAHSADILAGKDPYLPCLDAILADVTVAGEKDLGLLEIPLHLIVGTKTEGRKTAFASNFMPLLPAKTEFGTKWGHLSEHHRNEGINDPILVYEYLNRYYVMEGNKRVSVLKFYSAYSIMANVIRILPAKTDDKEIRIYYEFTEFFRITGFVDISFSQEGSFKRLLKATGTEDGQEWNDLQREDFRSVYNAFTEIYSGMKDLQRKGFTNGDAFLETIELLGYQNVINMPPKKLKEIIAKQKNQFAVSASEENVTLITDPNEEKEKEDSGLLTKLFSGTPGHLKIAFIYGSSVEASSWVYAHELGRKHVEEVLADKVDTVCYENCTSPEEGIAVMKEAIEDGCNLIFVTTPSLINACQKIALDYPEVRILNCAVKQTYSAIRTYYARMYEAKFLMGMIAGAVTKRNRIGYVADYPIYGTVASINAFALGVQMVNPNAKIYLEWGCDSTRDYEEIFRQEGIRLVSGRDSIIPGQASRKYGLYEIRYGSDPENPEEMIRNLATPMYHWGKFYELIINSILEGGWKKTSYKSTQALNYWYGLSTGVIDIICSKNLPKASVRLMNFLKNSISEGRLDIFTGPIRSRSGEILSGGMETLTTEQIITMDWLNENVEGRIPTVDEVNDKAKQIIKIFGANRPEDK